MCVDAVSYSHLPRQRGSQAYCQLYGSGLVFFDQPQAHSEVECTSRPVMVSEPDI